GSLADLREVTIEGGAWDENTFAAFASGSGGRLERLAVRNGAFAEASLARGLSRMTRLRELDLRATPVLERTRDALSQLATLETLTLTRCPGIDDDALARFVQLGSLRVLDLDHCRVTSAGLRRLAGLTKLEKLYLRNDKATVKAQAAGREALEK